MDFLLPLLPPVPFLAPQANNFRTTGVANVLSDGKILVKIVPPPASMSKNVRQQTPQSVVGSKFCRQLLFHFPGLIQAPVSVHAATKSSVENRNLLEKRQLHLHSVWLPRRVLLTKLSAGLPKMRCPGVCGGVATQRIFVSWRCGEG